MTHKTYPTPGRSLTTLMSRFLRSLASPTPDLSRICGVPKVPLLITTHFLALTFKRQCRCRCQCQCQNTHAWLNTYNSLSQFAFMCAILRMNVGDTHGLVSFENDPWYLWIRAEMQVGLYVHDTVYVCYNRIEMYKPIHSFSSSITHQLPHHFAFQYFCWYTWPRFRKHGRCPSLGDSLNDRRLVLVEFVHTLDIVYISSIRKGTSIIHEEVLLPLNGTPIASEARRKSCARAVIWPPLLIAIGPSYPWVSLLHGFW